MDINIAHIEENLVAACNELDKEKTGLVRIQSLQRVLFEDKKLVLTPFQINVLLGYAKPNAAGLVEYAVFAKKCHHLIDQMFTIEAMRRKAQFVQLGTFRRD